MSKYTGKSDFYDLVHMHYSVDEVMKSDVYTYDGDKIKFENKGDIVLYGPYTVASMAASKNDDGTSFLNVHLANQSYIDEREKESLFPYYLTAKWLIQSSKEPLKDIDNPKVVKKFGYDLDKKVLLAVYTYIVKAADLKWLTTAYPLKLKQVTYGPSAQLRIERKVSDYVLDKFHLSYYNDRRKELLDEYGKHTNKLSLKAMYIQSQINEYNSLSNLDNLEEL